MMMTTTPSNITIHKVTETVSIQNDVFSDIAIRPPLKTVPLCLVWIHMAVSAYRLVVAYVLSP